MIKVKPRDEIFYRSKNERILSIVCYRYEGLKESRLN
jgi:hypothetical protein